MIAEGVEVAKPVPLVTPAASPERVRTAAEPAAPQTPIPAIAPELDLNLRERLDQVQVEIDRLRDLMAQTGEDSVDKQRQYKSQLDHWMTIKRKLIKQQQDRDRMRNRSRRK